VGKVLMTIFSGLYYDPARPFGLFDSAEASVGGEERLTEVDDIIRAWLEKQDSYTLHMPVVNLFYAIPLQWIM